METSPATPPARQGLFRRLFSWRTVKRVLFVLAALITLGALLFAEEDWRGSRAWANYKREMEAKGENFDMARLIPPKVPDDQNFGMTPYFARVLDLPPELLRQPIINKPKPIPGIPVTTNSEGNKVVLYAFENRVTNILTEFRIPYVAEEVRRFTWHYGLAGDLIPMAKAIKDTNSSANTAEISDPVQAASIVLDCLKPCEPALSELQTASARPFCRFNIPYEELRNAHVSAALFEHLSEVKDVDQILALHAEAEMVVGRADQSLKDILLMFRVDDGIKEEPIVISQLVRYGTMAIILQAVGEGLAENRWSEPELAALQVRLEKTYLLAPTVQAWHGEREIYYNQMFFQSKLYPRGWSRLEQLNFNRSFQEMVLPCINLPAREINPTVCHASEMAAAKLLAEGPIRAVLHQRLIARNWTDGMIKAAEKAALAQSGVDMAAVVCALERYRLAQGQYPEDLDALVPRFAAVLPHDIINGQPLKYRRTDNGRFILYSVGWNEKDDGGVVAFKNDPALAARFRGPRANNAPPPRQDNEQGDWVWQYPENVSR